MAKKLKDFKVWHPPIVEDEPLMQEKEPFLVLGFDLNRRKYEFTWTGLYWLLLPWLFFYTKRIQFSLLEGLLGLAALASSLGAVVRTILAHNVEVGPAALAVYAVFHLFMLCFTRTPYTVRAEPERFRHSLLPSRVFHALELAVFAVAVHLAAYSIKW